MEVLLFLCIRENVPLLLLGTAFYPPPPPTSSPTPPLISSRGTPWFVCSDFLCPHHGDLPGFSTSVCHPKATVGTLSSFMGRGSPLLSHPSSCPTSLLPLHLSMSLILTCSLLPFGLLSSSWDSAIQQGSHSFANNFTFLVLQHTHMATLRRWMSPALYLFHAYTWVLKKIRGVRPWQGPPGCQKSHTFLGGPLLPLPSTLFKPPHSLSPPTHRRAWSTATLSFSLSIKLEEEFSPVKDDLLTWSPVFPVEPEPAS